jgi:predicted ester cyclase
MAARKTTTRRATARKTTARRSTARKSTAKRPTAKRATARKSTARKSTARKSTAKRATARKTTARRATAKRATARKTTTAKRSTAKRSTAKRATAKRATAKRATTRKSTAKRASAQKSTGRRATAVRPRTTSAAETNKAAVRAIEEAWNTSNLSSLDGLFAAGYQNHAAMPGMPRDLETAKMAHGMTMQAFPDRNVELLDIVGEGDTVVIRTRVTGTNTGGAFWFGAPANDRSIDFESWAMYRLEDGKVAESWGLNDGMSALVQLGTWEPPPMPGA